MTQRPPTKKPAQRTLDDIPPAPGSGRVAPRRKMTPLARLGSQVIFVVLVVAMVAIITFPIWRTVLFPDPVKTRFSQLSAEQQQAINSLPADQRDLLIKLAEANPAQAVDTARALLQPVASLSDNIQFLVPAGKTPTVIHQGTFNQQSALYSASGQAVVYAYGSTYFLSLQSLRVNNGPELHVAFAREPFPAIETRATWLDLGLLKGQDSVIYTLPNTYNKDFYKSVVIFDAKYGVIYSTASFGS